MKQFPASYYMIDRSSPMPAYQQISNSIIQRIGDREWEVGERLPSELQLSEAYGVSRVTMRQALAQLEQDGIIAKYQGRGIFLQQNPQIAMRELQLPGPDMNPSQRVPCTTIQLEDVTMGPKVAYLRLNLQPDAPLVYLQRIFYQNETPIGVNNAWFPKALVPDLAEKGLVENSITKTLSQRYGYETVQIDNVLEAVKLDAFTAQMLNSTCDDPGMKIDSIHYTDWKKPLLFANTIWLGRSTRLFVAAN